MNDRVNKKIDKYKIKAEREYRALTKSLKGQIKILKKDNNSKRLELAKLNEVLSRDDVEMNNKIETKFKIIHEKEMQLRVRMADEDKIELFGQIKELQVVVDQIMVIAKNYFEATENENLEEMKNINLKMIEISDNNSFFKEIFSEIDFKRGEIEGKK